MAGNPRYQEVVQTIAERIYSGEWQPKDRLPGEQVLARELQVGRSTLREGLRLLQEAGFIEIRNGVGNFVREPVKAVHNQLNTLESTGTMIKRAGYQGKTLNLWVRHMFPEPAWAEKLDLQPEEKVVVICRKRAACDTFIACAFNIFPEHLVENQFDTGITGGIFTAMERQCGVMIARALTEVKALNPLNTWDVQARELLEGPILLMEQLHFDRNKKPVLFSRDYIRTDMMTLSVNRERKL